MLPIVINVLLAVHVLVCVLLVFVVLLQRPRNEGLGSAFGGGVTENMFGAQTSNVLAKFTTWLGGAFFLLTLLLSMLFAMRGKSHDGTGLVKELESQPVPAVEVVETPTPEATVTEETAPAASPAASPAPTESTEPVPAETAPAETTSPTATGTPASDSTDTPAASEPAPAPAASPAG